MRQHVLLWHSQRLQDELDGERTALLKMENLSRRGARIVSMDRVKPHIKDAMRILDLNGQGGKVLGHCVKKCLAEALVFLGDEEKGGRRTGMAKEEFLML